MIRSRTRAKGSLILLRVTQLLFGTTCMGVATVLIFQLGPARTVTHGTSMRVLGAALLAFAFGAFSTVKEPYRHHTVFLMEIVFTALTAVSLFYRIIADHHAQDPAWLILAPVLICLALLLVCATRSDDETPPADG